MKFTFLFSVIFFVFASFSKAQTTVPSGFADITFSSGFTNVTGFAFDTTGRGYAWEKAGKVWIIDNNGTKLPQPLLNIAEEVGNWNEHGMVGFVLHPDFYVNGYFYVYYTVDRHYLLYYGTGNYSATTNLYNNATINRVVRYQADSATNFTTLVSNSRTVLIGATKQTGIPVTTGFHDGGCLFFGADKSLIIAVGDLSISAGGAADTGSYNGTYWAQAIADSILPVSHNVGSFRSQLVNSYSGKILRIDPLTGNGIAGNPFYDSGNPSSCASRVWALGLRNPFRCFLKPGTGSADITAADPGVIIINEVGYNKKEEISVCENGGENFGWPLYEGLSVQTNYMNATTKNPDAINPLGGGICDSLFMFKTLLKQATLDPYVQWKNPCDTTQLIPSNVPIFLHSRPVMDYNHSTVSTRVPSYNGYNAITLNVGAVNCNVTGLPFSGECNSGSVFYDKIDFPLQYQNALFQCDFDMKWIKYYTFDNDMKLLSVNPFATSTYSVLSITTNPKLGGLFYINYGSQIRRIYYTLNVNNPPQAIASSNHNVGASPLTVDFTSVGTFDPDNNPISYKWIFDDGDTSSLINPQHTFNDTSAIPKKYNVKLIVTDSAGLNDTAIIPIYINCFPPVVDITSIADSSLYATDNTTLINLAANVTDTIYADSLLKYEWYVSLYHNNHNHPEPVDTDRVTYAIVGPIGCGENYYYKVSLVVTNPLGLSATNTRYLLPDCDAPIAAFTFNNDTVCNGQTIQFTNQCTGKSLQYTWTFDDGTPATSNAANPLIQYNDAGWHNVKLKISNYNGTDSVALTNAVYVDSPLPSILNGTNPQVCRNGTPTTLRASASSAVAYAWLLNNQLLQSYTSDSAIIYLPGNYSCIATGSNGCIDTSLQTIVTNFNSIDTNIYSNPPSGQFCAGGNAVLTTNNPTNYSYQWYKAVNAIAGQTQKELTVNTGGAYKVIITDTNGCWQWTKYFNASLEPKAQISYAGINILCEGDSMLIAALYKDGYTYQWFNYSTLIEGATEANYFVKQNGRYRVMVTSSLGCTKTSNTIKALSTICYGIKTGDLYPFIAEAQPNPASNILNLNVINDKDEMLKLTIYDMLGNKVYDEDRIEVINGDNTLSIDVSNIDQGVYTLVLQSIDNSAFKKVMIVRQ